MREGEAEAVWPLLTAAACLLVSVAFLSKKKKKSFVISADPRRASNQMATLKRLNDDDVRAVFDCLHSNASLLPPPHLHFRIVPVQIGGHKLSPPSYEFDDGLYVLLKPPRKRKKNAKQMQPPFRGGDGVGDTNPEDLVPKHLAHLIMKEGEFPPEACKWSLSGPQYVNFFIVGEAM
jgi:hypothetical protein